MKTFLLSLLSILTPFSDSTFLTLRTTSDTDIPTEEDEGMVDFPLFFLGKYLIDLSIRLDRSMSRDDPESIHHSMDMSIDPDIGTIIEDREDDLRCLHSYPWQCLDEIEIIRDDTIIFLGEDHTSLMDISSFIPIEIHILDM